MEKRRMRRTCGSRRTSLIVHTDQEMKKAYVMTIGLLGFQTTIAAPVTLTGIGVHSGNPVTITFQPAEAGAGILFSRSEEHTSEPQSLMRISYAVFCLKKKR